MLGFPAEFLACQKGFEPPTFRLGVNRQNAEKLSIYRLFLNFSAMHAIL
nr:MAG TPA: hypothetical protein [Caudoviricetes sp.]